MTIPDRIAAIDTQLKEWHERRAQASEALNQAQIAIFQLQGARAALVDLDADESMVNDTAKQVS